VQELPSTTYGIAVIATEIEIWDVGSFGLNLFLFCHYKRETATPGFLVCYEECLSIYVCIYVCMCIRTYVCMYPCMYVCMYICIYMYSIHLCYK